MNWPDSPFLGSGGSGGRGGDRRAGGRGSRGGGGSGRRGRGAGAAEQAVGLAEAQPVAAAVLLGGALDVGDPVAELVRVGDGLARADALLLDRLGLVEEPLDLELGLLGEAGVVALVPDPHAHLEEADGVGVAEVEVLDAGLHQRGHDRQLLREPALLGLAAHPRGELRLAARRRRGTGWRRRCRRPPRRRRPRPRRRPAPPGRRPRPAAGGAIGGAPPGTSALTRMNLTLAMSTPRGTFMTWSWLLPSSAVNLPPSTLLARKPMWPSEPKSS